MRFFVSSTFKDLEEYREYVINYLKNITDDKTGEVIAMEYFPASEKDSFDICLEELTKSDFVIGIYGKRFGWEPDETGRSMTEIEFDRAKELGIPILKFVTYQELEEKQNRFVHQKILVPGENCGRFKSLSDFANVFHESMKKHFEDVEGYSYKSIWDDIKLIRQIIEEEIKAGSLRMQMYEDGAAGYAINEILSCVDNITSFLPYIRDLYYLNDRYLSTDETVFANGKPKSGAYWELIFLGLPNNLNKIRLAASFLKLSVLQNRLLTETWTEDLRQEVLKARDEYLEISQSSYHID